MYAEFGINMQNSALEHRISQISTSKLRIKYEFLSRLGFKLTEVYNADFMDEFALALQSAIPQNSL